MSDNPDKLKVEIETDEAGFDNLVQNIKGIEDEMTRLGVRGTAGLDALKNKFDTLASSFQTTRQSATQVGQSFNEITQISKNLDDTVAHVGISAKAAGEELTRLGDAESLRKANLGYGVEGGNIGPVAPTSPGSLYGAGRAFSAGGELARNIGGAGAGDALAGVGQLIRFEEGVQQLGPYLRTLNESLETSGGLIPQLTQALTGASVPMAGLVSAAIPLAAAAAAAGGAILLLKNRLDEGKDTVDQAIARQDKYFEALSKTPRELEDEINSLSDANERLKKQRADTQVQLGNTYAQNLQSDGSFLGNARQSAGILLTGLSGGTNSLTDSIGKLSAEITKNQTQVEADRDALEKLNNVKLAQSVRDEQDDRIQREQDYRQTSQLSSKAAQDHINALEEDKKAQALAVDEIYKMDAALNLSAVEHQKNQDAIASHLDQLKKDDQGIQDTTKALKEIIVPREKETAALNAQNEAIERHIGYMNREAQLTDTGTPEQVDAERRRLRGQISGDQYRIDQIQGRGKDITPEDQAKIDSLKASIKDATNELGRLDQVIEPIVLTNKALKDAAKAAEDFDKSLVSITNGLALQREQAIAREANAEKANQPGSLQDTEARYQIRLKEGRAETDLTQKTADSVTDILTKRDQKEQQIRLDYSRQLEDDQLKARDESEKIQVDAQRKQQDDLADHLNRIAEINRDAFAAEKEALYDRNFLSYAKLELKRQTDLADEDSKAQQKRDKVQQKLKEDEEDLVKSLDRQAEQRARDEQRKLDDAQTAAQQDIQQQHVNEERKRRDLMASEREQLDDLNHAEQYKISVLRQGLQEELALYTAQSQARIRIAAAERDAIQAQSAATIAALQTAQQTANYASNTQANYPSQAGAVNNVSNQNAINTNVAVNQSSGFIPFDLAAQVGDFFSGIFR